jgi:adenylate kinase family enzyme
MQKILIIGSGGAGKSTLARRLGVVTGIEVHHLDRVYWRPGLVKPPRDEWMASLQALLSKPAWILDGNYSGTLKERLLACDTVVFLDMPKSQCFWRVLVRAFKYRNKTRPDMAEGCSERLSFAFLSWVWNFPTRKRPAVLGLLEKHEAGRRIYILRSDREVEGFLTNEAAAVARAA